MSLVDIQRELFERYAAGDYRGALELIDDRAAPLDLLWSRVAWWRACLLSRLGELDAALDVLEAAVQAGAWWSESMFLREQDFDPLREDRRFLRLVKICEGRRSSSGLALPGLALATPQADGPFRTLVVLHGRAETFEISAGIWVPPVIAAGWAAVLPESSLRDSIDGPVWDDRGLAAAEVEAALGGLASEARLALDRCAIGGYSQGGRRALQLALEVSPRFSAVVVLNPTMLKASDVGEVLSSLGEPPYPTVSMITGDRDPGYEGQMLLAGALTDEGLEVSVDTVPGQGHYYPLDFADRLRWALAHVSV